VLISHHFPDVVLDRTAEDYAPAYIDLIVDPADRVIDAKHHESPIKNRLHPQHKVIEADTGKFTHTMEVDGKAQICIRAAGASSQKPMRFGLRVTEKEDYHEVFHESMKDINAQADKAKVDTHLSHMEIELRRIQMSMTRILSEADFAKERDSIFHKQTQSMHSATIFWPIVQVCVLIMTGFTQATHIVRFFKSRRII